ncbi:MAG: hypothetical protein RIF41_28735 [Polyangiaceae bacterium]
MAELLEAHLGHPVVDVVAALRVALASPRASADGCVLTKSSVVVHRLRNHLGALRALVFRLQQGMLTAHQHELLGRCQENARRMTAIFAAVEDLASLEAKDGPVEVEVLDVLRLVHSVIDSLGPWARRRGLHVHVDPRPSALRFPLNDRLMRLIISSLLETAAGSPAPRRLVLVADGDASTLRVVVSVDGAGSFGVPPPAADEPLAVVSERGWGDGRELAVSLLVRALDLLNGQAFVSPDRAAYRVVVPAASPGPT